MGLVKIFIFVIVCLCKPLSIYCSVEYDFDVNFAGRANEVLNNSESFEISRHKREGSVPPPNEGQTSLVFIFDDTGSMHDDLEQLRSGAKKIAKEFANRENNPIYDYILVRFNDPFIRPVHRTMKANELLKALDEITIGGGGDCEELAMGGIIAGMSVALPKSQVFVFTDASAKDNSLVDKAVEIAQAMQISVSFLVSGTGCAWDANFESFKKLAKRSHGIMYNVAKSNVEDVVRSIGEVLDTGLMPIESIYSETAGSHNFSIDVDNLMKKLSITLSGGDPRIDVCDPHKKCNVDVRKILDLVRVKMVAVDDPETGVYEIVTNSSTEHMIKISGTSDIRLRYGFSYILPEELSDTAPSPIKDITNYLSLFVWRNKKNHTFTTAELVVVTPRTEFSHTNHSLKILDPENCDNDLCIYVTEAFVPPLDTFKIFVRGFDSDGNPLKYLVSTNIESVDGDELKPKVKIHSREVNVTEGENLQLICKVTSTKRAVINWIFENKPVLDNPRKRVNFKRNDTVHLDIFGTRLEDEGSYFCQAKNPYGQHHEKVKVMVEPVPWQINLVEVNMTATEKDADFEIKCNITPPERKVNITWLHNGEEIEETDELKILDNTLKLLSVHRRHDGEYTCIGLYMGNIKTSTGYLTVPYQPEIHGFLLEKHKVNYGDKITLNCTADGNPKPSISWIRENKTKSNNFIEDFGSDDYGTHICEASNGIGRTAQKYVILETEYGLKPKVLIDVSNNIVVNEDSPLMLGCNAVSPKPYNFSWNFNGSILDATDENLNFFDINGTKQIVLNEIQLSDAGTYICSAENNFGKDEQKIQVDVKPIPLNIVAKQRDMQVLENDANFSIECLVSPSKRKLNLKWMFGDRILGNSSDFQIKGHSLTIKKIRRYHSGSYTCIGEFHGDIKNSTSNLDVLFQPEIIGPTREAHIVKFDDKIILNCSATGNPIPKISWIRDDESESGNVIEKFSPSDHGNHICEASNGVGVPALKIVSLSGKAKEPPKLIHSDYYHEVKTGQNLTLRCSCEKCGPIKYSSWWKVVDGEKNVVITEASGTLEEETKNYRYDLQLANLKPSDSNIYMCTIGNEYGITRETMRVNVTEGPVITEIVSHGAESVIGQIIKAQLGKELILTCKVVGSPKPEVRWYKNGDLLPKTSSFMENTIKFTKLSENDMGKYTCKATNNLGSTSKDVKLLVIQSSLPMNTIMVADEGQTVSLLCESRIWLFNDEVLHLDPARYTLIEDNLIFDVTYKDSGIYTCLTINGSSSSSFETVLMVNTPPLIYPSEDDSLRIQEGKAALMKCKAQGNPMPKVYWTHNGKKIDFSAGVEILKGGDLRIKSVKRRNSGLYVCRASNKVGHTERATTLIVTVPPKITSDFASKRRVRSADDHFVLACSSSGQPSPDVTWMKDQTTFVAERSTENFLNIVHTMPSGNYTCIARNSEGEDQKSIYIEALEPPILSDSHLQSKHHLTVGADLILLCPFINANQIDWYKDGIKYSGKSSGEKELFVVMSAQSDSEGAYTCVAKNEVGEANFTQYVRMFPSDNPFTYGEHYEQILTVETGETLILECKQRGDIFERTKWIKGDRIISTSRELLLEDLKTNNTGKYECKDWHDTGLIEQSYFLIVIGPPEIKMPTETWHAVKEGQSLELECIISAFPAPGIVWQKDNKNIEGSNSILTIKHAALSDAGLYKCYGSNDYGNVSIYHHVDVLHGPKLNVLTNEVFLRESDDLTLGCNASGNPLPVLIWTFNGTKLLGSEEVNDQRDLRYKILFLDEGGSVSPRLSDMSNLKGRIIYKKDVIILKITLKNDRKGAGVYTCHAINAYGVTEAEVVVKIIDEPIKMSINETSVMNVLAGLPIFLSCPWKSDFITAVRWQKNTNLFDKGLSHNQEYLSLPISRKDDSGTYKCLARNIGGVASKTFNINVRAPNYYEIDPITNDIILKCPSPDNREETIIWEEILLGEENVTDLLDSSEPVIRHDLPSSVYVCYHENQETGERIKKLEIQILKTSPVAYFETIRTVDVGDVASIRCPLILETRRSRIYWFKDGPRLMKGHFTKSGSILNFNPVKEEDAGTYKCQVGPGELERAVRLRTKRSTPNWSNWTQWTPCSKSCGKGVRTRERRCIQMNGNVLKGRSIFCTGDSVESQVCNDFKCPQSGNWSSWSDWSDCPEKCWVTITQEQPKRNRLRTCSSPPPIMGGKYCLGNSIESERCHNDPCSINGGWSAWNEWSECSVTCGQGRRTRSRKCNNPTPAYGGRECIGQSTQRQQCSRPACPVAGNVTSTTALNGWSEWSDWSLCSVTCGVGYQVRNRKCKNSSPGACPGRSRHAIKCEMPECPYYFV